MHQVRTKHRNVLLKPGQNRLADTKGLDGLLVGARQQMLVVQSAQPENLMKQISKR